MIENRKLVIIVSIAMFLALMTSIAMIVLGNKPSEIDTMVSEVEYATEIFDKEIISVEIIVNETDWQDMLDNAENEQYIMVDVIVNGTTFTNVGIRPKGNSSLAQVASSNSDRYSFRLKFDEYIDGQTCFGLESFVLNNMLTDNTYMKEYISYELMQEIGVDAPYFGFAEIKVNGEGWGLYLAVETYGSSFETRTYNTTSGMMYNVKSADIGESRIVTEEQSTSFIPPNQTINKEDDAQSTKNIRNVVSSGGSLEYTTDEISSYDAIFTNVVGDGTDSDFKEVIAAIYALSIGEDLESYFDIDQILKYLAAHTIVVNFDSYSSDMAQNYYIYENNGKVTILPWDYNQAWGGFQSTDVSTVVNFPIDTPVNGVEMSSRPLLEKLFSNPVYLETYHNYLQELMTSYFSDGKWEEKITQLDALISEYVKNDNTAFCTFEEYEIAVEAFITMGNLRYQSIQGQLDGTVPSTIAEQSANADMLIATGDLSLTSLGSMTNGGNREDIRNITTNAVNPQSDANDVTNIDENMPNREIIEKARQILQESGGTLTTEANTKLLEIGLTDEQISMILQIENAPKQRPDVDMQNTPEGGNVISKDITDGSSLKTSQTANNSNTINNLFIYSGLIIFTLLTTLFVAKKTKNY